MAQRILIAGVTVAIVVAAIGALSSASADNSTTKTLKLLDVAAPIDTFVDEGTPGPSTGDVEVFRDTLVWAADGTSAGTAEGKCTLIDPSTAYFECTIVTTLGRGNTITSGSTAVLARGATSTGAITGGTGTYEDAGGHGTLQFHPDNGPSVVTFTITK